MSSDKTDADVTFISALAAMLKDSDLNEIEVRREYGEDDTLKVRLSKQRPAPVQTAAPAPQAAAAAPAMVAAPAPQAAVAPTPEAPTAAVADPASDPGMVPSPMVGTAYLAPEPGAANFVAIGDKVTEGQTILIIEAMKTMNQIPAPHSGTLRTVLVADGDPVEFGSPLVVIE